MRWPLHPLPREYETLECWVGRLAAEYSVSLDVFCRHALGLTLREFATMQNDPPKEVLRKLEIGTGVPVQDLQSMSREKIFQRLMAALERLLQEDPGAFAQFGIAPFSQESTKF